MGLFDGIGNAEIYERGKFMSGGFHGKVEILKTLAKTSRKSGVVFIVELRIISTNMPDAHPEGSKGTWLQKMTDQDVAFPAIKAWAAACAGYEIHERDLIEREVAPELEEMLSRATDNPTNNEFVGLHLWLTTTQLKTRQDREFTRYDWSPLDGAESSPRDAVDKLQA